MAAIPHEWILWIDENIERGVAPTTLIETMLAHRFDQAASSQAVYARLVEFGARKQGQGQVTPVERDYMHAGAGLQGIGNSVDIDGHRIQVVMKLEKPQVLVFDNVLTPEECDQLIAASRSKLSRSTTVDEQTGVAQPHKDRTSQGCFFYVNENPFVAMLDKRIATLMQVPVENGEGLQILNYPPGAEYKPHYDYFAPELPGSQTHLAHGGQRTATLVIYLNEVEAGGETIFPRANLAVVPKRGSAVYFHYFNQGMVDSLTYHGGNPVLAGEKWIATKWVRERAYR
ncbi:2OG-Fe(II) oxygenase [Massilia sp. TS11]|uniref:2OG-Fe(II) oxygenase n=1 Tax=Massilia sp. TS11 TaxID=2908003 RepID=UPI001EDA5AD2|nr:2OG-Fe(II) oxygenase [Massilia sp. TS11]MCG2583076.1 2OG-Fe(II) oxygenase [Massilia sp. TS11]